MKVQYLNGDMVSIQKLVKFNKQSLNQMIEYYTSGLDIKSEEYKTTPVIKIIYSYMAVQDIDSRSGLQKEQKPIFHADKKQIIKPQPIFRGYNLPNTYDFKS